MPHPYDHLLFSAKMILDAVDAWATGYVLLREIGAKEFGGRLDGLLIPVSWESGIMQRQTAKGWAKAGLVGVEVKTSRSDFLRGMGEGQLERYRDAGICGLYLACPRGVAKAGEIPGGVGHLVVGSGNRCVCRKSPKWQDVELSQGLMWRIIFRAFEDFRGKQRCSEESVREIIDRISYVGSKMILRRLKGIVDEGEDTQR